MNRIGFIGSGNMAFAMAGAIYNNDPTRKMGAFDIDPQRVDLFSKSFSSLTPYSSVFELEQSSEIIILAVKPQTIDDVLSQLKDSKKIIVSIAAGITLKYLENKLPEAYIVRVMPNTPSLVGEMAAGVSFSRDVTDMQKKAVLDFLAFSGIALEVDDSYMDAVTGLSGSGPAFVARIIDSFVKAGVAQGLDYKTAKNLTIQTFLGTASLLLEKNMDLEELIKMVSSPGGTTIAGRSVLENSSMEKIVLDTVTAATIRSKELGAR
jgi:pyrroline-5-carboxylate reductase